MPRGRHARALAADYRWAIRMRSARVRSRPAPSSYSEGDRAPVLIVPGVYETWHFLRSIADRLNADGHAIHTVPGLGGNALPIPESAAIVARRLDELGLEDAVIVAHSKGGLIGKHTLLDRAAFERVRHIVAVATPFGGSSLARFTLARPLRAFRVADPVIRALGAERELNARITSIYPRFDHHIPNGSRLDGAQNLELPVVGHFRILR
ncbi:MAG: alpha/beta fold hydrolase, partial [Microbacteriaceae bacterium]